MSDHGLPDHELLADLQAQIARQENEIAALRSLVRTLAERNAGSSSRYVPDVWLNSSRAEMNHWSEAFRREHLSVQPGLFPGVTPEWAYGDARGQGVRVAVIDTGVLGTPTRDVRPALASLEGRASQRSERPIQGAGPGADRVGTGSTHPGTGVTTSQQGDHPNDQAVRASRRLPPCPLR